MTDSQKKSWNKKIFCCNYGVYCMNKAVAENGDGHWYCYKCFEEMIDDIDEVEVDENLGVCLKELELQTS